MKSILVSGGIVITMDPLNRVIEDGAVYMEDGLIVAVDSTERLKRMFKPDLEIGARHHIILPGLVDSHVHTTHALIRGLCQSSGLEDCLTKTVWPAQAVMDGDDAVASAELSMLEMLTTGTTTFVEAGLHRKFRPDRIASSVERFGLRAVLSKTVMDSPGSLTNAGPLNPAMIEEPEQCFSDAKDLSSRFSSPDSRIRVWLAPRALGVVSRALFRRISQFAKENEMGITMHLRESAMEVEYMRTHYGTTPVSFARDVGLLGHSTLLAHMVDPDGQDVSLLRETGTAIAHCPTSNAQLSSGYCPAPLLIKAGIRVGLGCDGVSHNFTYDMFSEMRFAALVHKASSLDPTVMPAHAVLGMATIGGARAIGEDKRIGSLEVGKEADIITVDLNRPHLVPLLDPVSSIVYSGSGTDVDNVIVGGNILVEGGRVVCCDPEQVIHKGKRSFESVMEKSGLRLG